MTTPEAFLRTVAGYTRAATDGSADRAIRIGVIDPAYTTGNPKVTFEGESTMSTKGYPFLDSYKPVASNRVILVPVGTTYLIAGCIDNATNNIGTRLANLPQGILKRATSTASTTATTANVTTPLQDSGVGNLAFTAVLGRIYRVKYTGRVRSTAGGINAAVTCRDGGGSAPTSGSTVVASAETWLPQAGGASGGNETWGPDKTLTCVASPSDPDQISAGTHTLGIFYARLSGSTTGQINIDQSSSVPREFYIEDCGLTPP